MWKIIPHTAYQRIVISQCLDDIASTTQNMSNRKLKIFIIEDTPAWVTALKERLGNQFDYVEYDTGEACMENLVTQKPDIVILDHELAGPMTGLDTLKQIKKQGIDVPVIAFTAQETVQIAVDMFELGVYDYVVKGDHAPLRVKHFIKRIQAQEERKNEVVTLKLEIARWKLFFIAACAFLLLVFFYIYLNTCPANRILQWDPLGVESQGYCATPKGGK